MKKEDNGLWKVKMVIFDFDGVIMDTEWAHAKAKEIICSDRKLALKEDLHLSVGHSNVEFWKRVIAENRVNESPERLAEEQYRLTLKILEERQQKESPGLRELLRQLKEKEKLITICSGSDRGFIVQILDRMGLTGYFDCIMGGEKIENLKPAPDIFMKMLDKMQISAKEAVVIEDSASRCRAAKEADIACLGYLNCGNNSQVLENADVSINQLQEVLDFII